MGFFESPRRLDSRIMKHARQTKETEPADDASPVSSALDAIEQALAKLGPDPDVDDAALALWEPARALGAAASEA
jgi:hypothetical protein